MLDLKHEMVEDVSIFSTLLHKILIYLHITSFILDTSFQFIQTLWLAKLSTVENINQTVCHKSSHNSYSMTQLEKRRAVFYLSI